MNPMRNAATRPVMLLAGVVLATTAMAPAQDNLAIGAGLLQQNLNRVRVFLADGTPQTTDFLAYAAGTWGVNVAVADVDPGAFDEITTGPGPGPVHGPQVRSFSSDGTPIPQVNFYAYGTLRAGVNVVTGDIDGSDEYVTGAGPQAVFGPHVRGWHYDGNTAVTAIAKVNFFAYGTLRYGVNVGVGSIDPDGFEELLTGPGPGPFTSNVRGWNYDGVGIGPISKVNFTAYSNNAGGAKVVGGDVDDDQMEEIIALATGQVRGFDYDGVAVTPLPGFAIAGDSIGSGDAGDQPGNDLFLGDLTTSDVRIYEWDGAALNLYLSFTAFPGSVGVTSSGGDLGF